MGIIGSLAGTQRAQAKGSDTDRAVHETGAQSRETKTSEKAELAAGIGQTSEDAETSDRDADGRRLWEAPLDADETVNPEDDEATGDHPNQSKDPDGNRGANLDLSG